MFYDQKTIQDLEDILFKIFKIKKFYNENDFSEKLFKEAKKDIKLFLKIRKYGKNIIDIEYFLIENEFLIKSIGTISNLTSLNSKKIKRRIKLNQISKI
jgi:hypothetical protein